MKKIVTIIFCAVLLIQPSLADEKSGVLKTVKTQIDLVIDTLKRKDLDKKTKDQKIIDAVIPFFDFDRMAKLSLGKKGWKAMNKKQRAEFSDLFVKRLQEFFLEKLDIYTDEEVVVEEAKNVKKRIHVITHLVSKDDKMEMVFKFYKTKKGWKVYDVIILGVGMVQTYRSQFASILKESSIEELLNRLRVTGGLKEPTSSK